MKQLIKRIFQTLLGISLFLLISGLGITYFFSNKVEKKVINKMQDLSTSELQLGDIAFSVYEKFPSSSVKITDLLAFEKEGFDDDTLFYAKTTYIELSIIDIILGKIDIKRVVVDSGDINIKYDSDNNPNFTIFKTNAKNKKKLTLSKLFLIDTHISYSKKGVSIQWEIQESFFGFNGKNVIINTKLFSEKLIVHSRDYIHKKQMTLDLDLDVRQDSILIQKRSTLEIENVQTELSGKIIEGKIIDLDFAFEEQDLISIINNTPEHLKSIYHSFLASGIVTCSGNLKGLVSKESNLFLDMTCNVEKGNFNLKSQPFILKHISLNAKITNGEKRNFHTTKIEISDFDSKTENGFLKGDFSIQNLNKYYLTANLSSSWDLAEINHYFDDSPFFNLQGILSANTKYSGFISFDSKFENYFLESNHTSKVNFKEVGFTYKNFNLGFNLQAAKFTCKNNRFEVEKSAFTIADSDLDFSGNITDLIGYILKKKNKIDISGRLNSTYMKLDELLTLKDTLEGKYSGTMPNWINADLNTSITTFSYNNFIASDLLGLLTYKNNTLIGEDVSLNSLNGSISGNFKFYESKANKLTLFSQLNLKQLNIRNAFLAFNNFNQDFITAKHLKGIGTAEIEMQATWNPDFVFEKEQLKVKSHLIIEKGELLQFKPLESLSDYVSLEDLKTVKFSTLENTIEIANQVITIPTMEIKSSALSVFISGVHTFEQEIDYQIKLLLSELMSTKFRKKNTQLKKTEFGEVKENGKIFNTIYFKMTGNSDDPEISFDGIRFREDVRKAIKEEKETIITIIKQDVLLTEDQEKQEKGQAVIVEWDDKQ